MYKINLLIFIYPLSTTGNNLLNNMRNVIDLVIKYDMVTISGSTE